jgi:branched-subunit amino acid aminotransferase/4-amino-4-deoxychorismate lyase
MFQVDVLVLLDEYNRYLECCIGNIFIYRPREQKWYTPQSSEPLLPGVMRSILLSNAKSQGERIMETRLIHEPTDEIWMSNALRGLCPLNVVAPQVPKWAFVEINTALETLSLKHFKNALNQP